MATYKFIQYMCSYCGKKETRAVAAGRPAPGKCPKKTKDRPHSWVINKRM